MDKKKVLIFVVSLVILVILGNLLFRFSPYRPLVTLSMNMKPTYKEGSVLFLGPATEYQVDDVVLYDGGLANPSVVRLVDTNDDGTFVAKGDNNPASLQRADYDETKVPVEKLKGKILFGMPRILWLIILYGFNILIAYLITTFISKKL